VRFLTEERCWACHLLERRGICFRCEELRRAVIFGRYKCSRCGTVHVGEASAITERDYAALVGQIQRAVARHG